MEAYYSISNKDITLYNKKTGLCIAIIPCSDIYAIMRQYNISDHDLHIAF